MSRKRLSKQQLKRDRFVEQTFDWAHWVETHRREVLVAAVAGVLLVAGFFVWRGMQASAAEAAARDYLAARQAYDSGNWALAASDLETFVRRHGGTPYEDDAAFFRTSAYYRGGQLEQAIASAREFLDEHEDSPFADNTRRVLAAAYQGLGQFEQAAGVYREMVEEAGTGEIEVQLRSELAEVYMAQNRRDLAAEQYRLILEREAEGALAAEARRNYAELTVTPLTGSAGPETEPETAPGDAGAPAPTELLAPAGDAGSGEGASGPSAP